MRTSVGGKDFPEPVVLAGSQKSYSYLPALPGEKHATVTATGPCGAASANVKYQVK